jgi:hypothetical protein
MTTGMTTENKQYNVNGEEYQDSLTNNKEDVPERVIFIE